MTNNNTCTVCRRPQKDWGSIKGLPLCFFCLGIDKIYSVLKKDKDEHHRKLSDCIGIWESTIPEGKFKGMSSAQYLETANSTLAEFRKLMKVDIHQWCESTFPQQCVWFAIHTYPEYSTFLVDNYSEQFIAAAEHTHRKQQTATICDHKSTFGAQTPCNKKRRKST